MIIIARIISIDLYFMSGGRKKGLKELGCDWGFLYTIKLHKRYKLNLVLCLMYLGYLDDSGQSSFGDAENFCLSMTLIHEHEWKNAYDLINKLRMDFIEFLDQSQEIHMKDILNSKRYDINHKVEKLSQMYKLILEINFKIISCVIVKPDIENKELKLNEIAFTRLFEKTSLFLKQNGSNDKCIIFCDREKNEEDSHRCFRRLRLNGSKYVKEDYFIEDIVFDNGNFRICLQIADMVVVLIRRYIKALDKENLNELDQMFLNIFPKFCDKFDMTSDGLISGYGITFYPKSSEKEIRG